VGTTVWLRSRRSSTSFPKSPSSSPRSRLLSDQSDDPHPREVDQTLGTPRRGTSLGRRPYGCLRAIDDATVWTYWATASASACESDG
jgi:hypothetical protein